MYLMVCPGWLFLVRLGPHFARMLRLLLLAVAFGLSKVKAQATDATCLPFYQWTFNSHKQSPCEVASTLLGVCNGGSYDLPALPEQHHYAGPTLTMADPCQCNTVVYSLISACGACQGRTYQTWSSWSANCANVSINSYPESIPPETFVPGWAYLDVKAHDFFDETTAKQNANRTESTAAPSPTSTSLLPNTVAETTTSTSHAAASVPANNNGSSSASSSEAHANIVMGSIVGSLLGAALLISATFWYFSRRRRMAQSGTVLEPPIIRSPTDDSDNMRQYLANTVPSQLASSSANTSSLASPTSAVFSNSSVYGSVRSMEHSNV